MAILLLEIDLPVTDIHERGGATGHHYRRPDAIPTLGGGQADEARGVTQPRHLGSDCVSFGFALEGDGFRVAVAIASWLSACAWRLVASLG